MATEVTLGEGASISDFVLYSYVLNSVASFVSMCVCVCVCVCVFVCGCVCVCVCV
jgi:hypothetical protein